MEHAGSNREQLLMPWLAPVVLGAVYAAELLHEGGAGDPALLALQLVFAVPLVAASSVLLAILELQARAGVLTSRMAGWLRWTPRVLVLLFVSILAVFSVDVFEPGLSTGEVALALLVHNLPALGLLAAALAAWRWPPIGAVGLATFSLGWFMLFYGRGFAPSVVLLVGVTPLVVAALFVASWLWDRPAAES